MADTARFKRKIAAMKTMVPERMQTAVARQADSLVAEMQAMLAIQQPAVAAQTEIDWTKGEAPKGSVTVGRAEVKGGFTVTIYARGRQGSGFSAAWFEFGTAPRVQKTTGRSTGQIVATPFFFPVYRANRQRVLSNLRATLRRAMKKIDAM